MASLATIELFIIWDVIVIQRAYTSYTSHRTTTDSNKMQSITPIDTHTR